MKKTKLLFIIWSFTYGGGAEKVLANFVNKLDKEKYEIDILEYWHSNNKVEKIDERINVLTPIIDESHDNKIKKYITYLLLLFFTYILRKKFIKKEYDYEIAWNYMIPTFLLSKKKKTISWNHGSISDLKSNSFNRFMQQKQYKKVDKIVAISNNTYQSIIEVYPEFKDKTLIINNSFDFKDIKKLANEKTEIEKKKFTMLYIGRFDENKNPLYLIEVANQLKQKKVDFELWMIGKGDLEEKLKEKINNYHLNKRVKLLGYKSNPYPYFKLTDIVVLASKQEGFPTVIAEGLSLGKPFVSTQVGGIEELSDNQKVGFYTNDINEYIEKIILLKEDKVIYNKMSKDGKKHIAKFTQENQIEKFEKLLQEISNKTNKH